MTWRIAALLLCLTGAAQAEAGIYRFYVAHTGTPTTLEWSSPGAGWDVTVGFDNERCEIYCTYRRIRNPFSANALVNLLPPPATTIRIQGGPGSKPETIVVDPAGLRYPGADSPHKGIGAQPGLPGRGLTALVGPAESAVEPAAPVRQFSMAAARPRLQAIAGPLRI